MPNTKRRPGTGDKRKTQQPLKIDKLPIEVRDAITYLKNTRGLTWQEIEEKSGRPYSEKWARDGGGFVNWDEIPTRVLELFPEMRLPHSNLHRWYDLRVSQVTAETLARSAQAREIAAAFAKSIVDGDDDAVMNAARDQIMLALGEDATPKGRMNTARHLISLAEMMQERRLNDIKDRKVQVDEQRLKILQDRERLVRQKLEAETAKASRKLERGKLTPADLAELVQRTFGIAPEPAHG